MVDITTQEQIVREAPEIEAFKLGLLELAKQRGEIPVDIPAQKVAGYSNQELKAMDMANQGIGSYAPYLSQAGGLYGEISNYLQGATGAANQGANLATQLGFSGMQNFGPAQAAAYMDPYQQAVTQDALKEYQRQSQIAQTNQASSAVKAGAYGGSREGIQRSELARNLADIQSRRIFEDYSKNYQQAQGAFQNQQGRALQAGSLALNASQLASQTGLQAAGQQQQQAQGIASLGQQLSGLQQGDVSFLSNVGQQNRNYQQNVLDAARQTELQRQYEPFQRIGFISDIYKGAPSSQQTLSMAAAPSPSFLSQVGGLGVAALGAYNLFKK